MISTYLMSLEIDKFLRENINLQNVKFSKSLFGWNLTYTSVDVDVAYRNKLGSDGYINICYVNEKSFYCKVTYSMERSKSINYDLLISHLEDYTKKANMKYSLKKHDGYNPTSYYVEVIPEYFDDTSPYDDVSLVILIPLLVLFKVK